MRKRSHLPAFSIAGLLTLLGSPLVAAPPETSPIESCTSCSFDPSQAGGPSYSDPWMSGGLPDSGSWPSRGLAEFDQPYLGSGISFKHGIVFAAAGGGTLEEHFDGPGWTLELTVRQPIPRYRHRPLFWEFGGSYMHTYGDDNPEPTSGTFTETIGGVPISTFLPDFFDTSLRDLRRGGVLAGVGRAWYPPAFNSYYQRRVQLTLAGGLGWGHVKARFNQVNSASLQQLINAAAGTVSLDSDFGSTKSDSYFGMYVRGGFGLNATDLRLGSARLPDATLLGEIVYDHAWFKLGQFSGGDNGLGTVSALVTLTFSQ